MTVQNTNMGEKMFYGGKVIIQDSTNNINVNRYSTRDRVVKYSTMCNNNRH